ncbi:uncharacterized protein SOCE26_054970 [Sorangium cellulosum]|uniref:Uncharacterized protein n=1 Tax=Sorangium cellulosum TaxID=56 RepID=A0A2L0EXL7_SORCE|nr:hypothetical protein [Sorangium cellulosum]AUX44037.1 uncharacterized protein SOCE26_054970 [Sorangium cellulosum]
MATGNTIGRIVGQSPARAVPPEQANPVVQLVQGVERLVPMWQQLDGLAQQLARAGRGGAPVSRDGARGARGGARGLGGAASPEELCARLTELGRMVRTPPEVMDGPAGPEQIRTRQITEEILQLAMGVSGPRGQPVHELALGAARERIAALAATAPSPAQAAQAVDNAALMAQMRGANGPVLEMLRSVLEGLQQALRLIQGVTGRTDGAQIRA